LKPGFGRVFFILNLAANAAGSTPGAKNCGAVEYARDAFSVHSMPGVGAAVSSLSGR
jgi:hypothetical protein